MTKVEIQVQNGKVTITVGGETTTYSLTEATIRSLGAILAQAEVGEASAAAKKQPVPPKPTVSSGGMLVLGPLVIEDSGNSDSSGGTPAADDTRGGGRPEGCCALLLGPIVVCGGRVKEARKVIGEE